MKYHTRKMTASVKELIKSTIKVSANEIVQRKGLHILPLINKEEQRLLKMSDGKMQDFLHVGFLVINRFYPGHKPISIISLFPDIFNHHFSAVVFELECTLPLIDGYYERIIDGEIHKVEIRKDCGYKCAITYTTKICNSFRV